MTAITRMQARIADEIEEVLASIGLRLGMDIPGRPPEKEMAKKLEQELLG